MADTYGVVHADVAAELPGIFPGGFTVGTKPTAAAVTSLITTADALITLKVIDVTGTTPDDTDRAAVLAKRYIIDWVKAQVVRIVYAGNDPEDVARAAAAYDANVTLILEAFTQLGEQAAGDGLAASSRVVAADNSTDPREFLLTDDDLDGGSSRTRRF